MESIPGAAGLPTVSVFLPSEGDIPFFSLASVHVATDLQHTVIGEWETEEQNTPANHTWGCFLLEFPMS